MTGAPRNMLRDDRVALLLIGLAAILAHGASLSCGWIWDDDSYVTANRVVSSPYGVVDAFIPGRTPQYYPLVFAGFWAQHAISGIEPFAYHLVNVLMHAASSVLLCVVARRLAIPGSAWIALVFAVHPMGVESVAWVTERKNVQSMLFALGSVWFFLRHLEADPARRAGTWIASFALFACALLSKTTAIFVPPCLVMIAIWMRRPIDRAFVMRVAPYFVLGIALGLHTAHVEQTVVGARGSDFDPTIAERVQLAPRIVLFYLGSFFVPREQVFIYPQLRIDARDAMLWAPLALSLVATWRCVVHWRRGNRAPLLLLLWIGAALFPALGFIDVWPFRYSVVADHFAYAAMPAFALILVFMVDAGAKRLAPGRTVAPRVLLGAFVIASAVLSVRATAKYESEETLWMKTREQNPTAWIAHNNLATIRLREAEAALAAGDGNAVRAKAGEAADLAAEAAALKPDEFTNAVNASEALRLLGDNGGALKAIDRAVALAPHIAENHWLRARVLEALGRTDEARDALLRSVEAGAGSFDELAARRDLMRLAAAGGDNAAALAQCRRIV
ncbi:MAG: glycosyltransferase family 39 protein, partial [Phycisphaerales bacterium]